MSKRDAKGVFNDEDDPRHRERDEQRDANRAAHLDRAYTQVSGHQKHRERIRGRHDRTVADRRSMGQKGKHAGPGQGKACEEESTIDGREIAPPHRVNDRRCEHDIKSGGLLPTEADGKQGGGKETGKAREEEPHSHGC
ncbi:MAG: hypothetical protein ABI557_03885 [Aureliella sp.]